MTMEALLLESVKADDWKRAAFFILQAKSLSVDDATAFLLRVLDNVRNPDTLRVPPELLPGETGRQESGENSKGPEETRKRDDLIREFQKSPLDENVRKKLRKVEHEDGQPVEKEDKPRRKSRFSDNNDTGKTKQEKPTPAAGQPWIDVSHLDYIEGVFKGDEAEADAVMLVMLVPNEQHICGYIIGQKGAHIKEVERATGVKVRFSPGAEDRPSENQRSIAILGTLKGVTQAQHLITNRLGDKIEHPPIRIMVPDRAVHMLIGKKGQTVNKMTREAVSSSIKFEQFLPEGSTGREVTISAQDPLAATHAQYLVARHLLVTNFGFPLEFSPGIGLLGPHLREGEGEGRGGRHPMDDRMGGPPRGGPGGRDGGGGGWDEFRGGPPGLPGRSELELLAAAGRNLGLPGGMPPGGGLGLAGDLAAQLRQAEAAGIDLASLAAGAGLGGLGAAGLAGGALGGIPGMAGLQGAMGGAGASALVQHMQQQQLAAALASNMGGNPAELAGSLMGGGPLGGRDGDHMDMRDAEVDHYSMRLPNDRHLFAFIIGKGGKCMRELEFEAKCALNVQKEAELTPGMKNRLIHISGTPASIKLAISMLEQRVKEYRARNP